MEQLRACEAARLAAFKAVLGDFLQSDQAVTHLHALVCGSVCLDVCVDVYAYRWMDGWLYG